jgi:O-antigen ligase
MRVWKSQYEQKLELVFKIIYLILAFSTFNPYIYNSAVQPIFVKLTLLAGAVVILIRLVRYRTYRKMPCLILMLLFCASFVLSAIMNRQYGIVENGKWIIWTGIQFFALYVCDVERDTKEYAREFRIVSHIIIVYSMITTLIGLGMLVTSSSTYTYTADGELMIGGFTWGRLWGLFTDPNYGAVFSVIAILLSLVFCMSKKGRIRAFYIVSIILNFLYLVFSDSRTGEVALIVSLAIFLYLYLLRKWQNKKGILKYGLILCVIFLIGAGSILGIHLVKTEYNKKLAPVLTEVFKDKNGKKKDNTNKIGRKKDLENDVSNGRIELWISAVEVWETSPVYGAGYSTFIPYAKEHTPDTYAVNNKGSDYNSLHNELMNILAFQGALGFLLFLALGIYMCWYVLGPVIKAGDEQYLTLSGMLACVGAVAVGMMFLTEGLYTLSPGSFVLWVFGGYLVQYSYRERKGAKESEGLKEN